MRAPAPARLAPQAGFWLALIASVGVALFSYRYLLPHAPAIPPNVLANRFTRYGVLTVHAGFAATALILGPWQFIARVRASRPTIHRWIGRLYVTACLAGGTAGLVLAMGASTGWISSLGFGTLAILWMHATARAWLAIRARHVAEHRRWMIRSFTLTFAAVTLRLYLPLAMMLPVDGADSYRAISFLCWVPNLVLAEVYLARRPG
jgi:uncharacterized membrane protein